MIYILLILLVLIFIQDLKERHVYLFLLIGTIFIGGGIYFIKTILIVYLMNISINILFILLLFCFLSIYSKFKLRKNVFEVIGIGDFFFFLVFAVSFPLFSFFILFSISLIFSLLLFLILKHTLKHKTVPLAGFQAFFLFMVLVLNSIFDLINIYAM